ncbi:hypothetical protein LINGRAPRIM_LOCUS350 [Linum grandiflorum]
MQEVGLLLFEGLAGFTPDPHLITGVDGAVETGNKHLPHVSRRVHSNSTRCCESDGLGSDRRCIVRGVRQGDELGFFG